MSYRVDVLPKAIGDLDEAYCYAAKRAPLAAYRWASDCANQFETWQTPH